MKKYIATAALCLATVLPTFAQTRRVMTVHQKDGTTKVYKVNSIENVTFTDEALATLSNQWAYNDDVKDLSKVTMLDANGSYEFALYGSDNDTKPVFELTIPQSLMGQKITLGSDDAQDVKVAYNGETPKLTGTLQARFDKFKKNVTITLEAETADYSDLRCKWTNGAFTQIYSATNSIKTTNVNDVKTYDVASALVLNPATTGAATTFAFGDVEATTADGLLAGKIGVAVSISASKLYNGTIDLAADADERRDARNRLDRDILFFEQAEDVDVRAVEHRVAERQERDILARLEEREDFLLVRLPCGIILGKTLDHREDLIDDLDVRLQIRLRDAQRDAAVLLLRLRRNEDVCFLDGVDGFDRQEFRVARADADAVKNSAHVMWYPLFLAFT